LPFPLLLAMAAVVSARASTLAASASATDPDRSSRAVAFHVGIEVLPSVEDLCWPSFGSAPSCRWRTLGVLARPRAALTAAPRDSVHRITVRGAQAGEEGG